MNIEFDKSANAAYIRLTNAKIADSEEMSPGIVYDYDDQDKVVGIEILGIKQRTPEEIKALNFPFKEEERRELQQKFGAFTFT